MASIAEEKEKRDQMAERLALALQERDELRERFDDSASGYARMSGADTERSETLKQMARMKLERDELQALLADSETEIELLKVELNEYARQRRARQGLRRRGARARAS